MFDDIFSRLDTIQYTNVADRRTDGQTPADSKDRANAYIASRGKNKVNFCTRTIIPGYSVIPKRIRLNK